LYNKETGEILGVHIIGMHAADLIQECANAMAAGSTVKEMAMMVKKLLLLLLLLILRLLFVDTYPSNTK
jgi:hypothetical protein